MLSYDIDSDILQQLKCDIRILHYVRSGCTGTVIGVEGFDSLSQIYFDNMFRPLLGHLQVIQFWRLLVCNVSHILILYSV
jgi:hypothetical protein